MELDGEAEESSNKVYLKKPSRRRKTMIMMMMKQHGYLRGCRLVYDRVTVRPGYKRKVEEQSKKEQNKDNCGIHYPSVPHTSSRPKPFHQGRGGMIQ